MWFIQTENTWDAVSNPETEQGAVTRAEKESGLKIKFH